MYTGKNQSPDLNAIKKQLREDIAPFKPIPLWAWNGKLEETELRRQVRWMADHEFGGFFMHARAGLETNYLSDEWMHAMSVSADEANRNGIRAWIYDEHGWPSGFAGGKLLKEEANRDQYIEATTGAFDATATVSYRLTETAIERTTSPAPDGEYLNLFIRTAGATADILNPDVVKQFIALTHETYKTRFGDQFRKNFAGFFTDEPQFYRWHTPFTRTLYGYFRAHYNEDILDRLGLLFVEKEGFRDFRYRFYRALQDEMTHAFSQTIYDWCDANGMIFTGHYVEETSLFGQMMCCAGPMPMYRYEHIPGIDWLGLAADNLLPPRQLASVAAQYGKKQTLSESFGCCGWQTGPRDVKRIGDFEFLNGVNTLCQHFVPYAEYGSRKKDYPAHYSGVNPWVDQEFGDFNRYFARLGALMSHSREVINVAVLHPLRGAYLTFQRENEACIAELDQHLSEDIHALNAAGINFHFLDETLLAEDGFVRQDPDAARIGCGLCAYEYLILPHTLTMDKTTEALLRDYVEKGGRVLLLGDAPTYLEGEPFTYDYLTSTCTWEDIQNAQPYHLSAHDPLLYATYRHTEDADFMMIMNADTRAGKTVTYDLGASVHSFRKLDLRTLEETRIPLTVTLEPGASLIVFPDPADPDPDPCLGTYTFRLDHARVSCEENRLTVDHVRFSQDGRNYSEPYPCPALFDHLLKTRYEGPLWLRYEFDVRDIPAAIRLSAEDSHAEELQLNGHPFTFTSRSEKESHLLTADITPFVQKGRNTFDLRLHWFENANVYQVLYGGAGGESLGNCLLYDCELEAVYLSGDFGVYTDTPYTDALEPDYTYGSGFYIGKTPETVTEPTTDGFPFFAGTLHTEQTVTFSTDRIRLHLNGTWHVAYVKVNGQSAGKLIYGRDLDISAWAHPGENLIEIDFVIGNRNLLGPHHLIRGSEDEPVSPDLFDLPGCWNGTKCPRYAERYSLIKLNCR